MRISASQIYQRAIDSMRTQNSRLAQLQEQMDGKRVHTPSDDPFSFSQIDLMNQWIKTTEQFDNNRKLSEGVLAFEESVLANAVRSLQDLRELQVSAGDTSLSKEDRKSMAIKAQNIVLELQQLANSQDTNGNYIFSGSLSKTEAISRTSTNQYVYNGDETQRFQFISQGSAVALNDTAKAIFMQIANGNGDFTVTDKPPLNTGSAILTTGSVVNRAAYVPDNYTLQFALNTSNQLVVMVSGVNSGNVIPSTGNPDDAPLYQAGTSIQFNGIELVANGAPIAGDSYSINPSHNESLFSTGQRIVDNLNASFESASDRARSATENNQLMAQIDTALANVINSQAAVGARLNQLSSAEELNSQLILTGQTTLVSLEEADLAEVISSYSMQAMYLEIAQKSFTRIQGLSIFNYLR